MCTEERRRIRSEARKRRRRWQADVATWKLAARQETKPAPLLLKDDKGRWEADPRKWAESLQRHCAQKYGRPAHLEPLTTVSGLNEKVRCSDQGIPEWSWSVTLRARASLSKGKSTGRSSISAEVLQALSAEAMWSVHMLLRAHYEGDGGSPLSWTQIRWFLLPKMRRPQDWEGFRGICLLNVVSKLFMSGIIVLLKEWAKAHLGRQWTEAPLFGFEAGCKCEDLLLCLQSRIAMASEWPRRHPIVVASTDIKQAFDYVTPHAVAGCLDYWHFPAALTRSLVRESSGSTATAVCPGLPPTSDFVMERSIRQGGVESPWCFNLIVRTIYSKCGSAMRSCGASVPLLGQVSLLGWADNLLFIGESVKDVQLALDTFTAGMFSMGMRWKPSSMQYMYVGQEDQERDIGSAGRGKKRKTPQGEATGGTTDSPHAEFVRTKLHWQDDSGTQHDFELCESLEVLGCLLAPLTLAAVRHRLSRAEIVFLDASILFLQHVDILGPEDQGVHSQGA